MLAYQPTRDLTLNFSVENLLNQYYRPYAIPVGSDGDTQNDVKWASAGAGIVFKGGLRYHFGGTEWSIVGLERDRHLQSTEPR